MVILHKRWPLFKIHIQKITTVGRNVEKLEVLSTVGENIKWGSHYKMLWRFLRKLKVELWYDPEISSFPGSSAGKESTCNAGDPSSIPGSERSPGEWNGYPLHYSDLEDSLDRGTWQAIVPGVTKSRTQLSDFQFHFPAIPTSGYLSKSWTRISYALSCSLQRYSWEPRYGNKLDIHPGING